MDETKQSAEVVSNPDTEKLWKRFKSYFWVLFVLHLIPKGFSGIETTTNEQATTLFFVALGITLLVALGMVINVGLHAYLFSKKKVYALLGLLGLWWAGVVGIALAYFAVQWVYYKSINKPFPLSTKIIAGALAAISLLLMFSVGSALFSGFGQLSNGEVKSSQGWATITSPDGQFSVELPRNPQYERDDTPGTLDGYSYTASEQDDHVQYVVKYENYSSVAQSTGVDLKNLPEDRKKDFLNGIIDSTVDSFDLQNFVSQFTTHKGYLANKFSGKIVQGNDSGNVEGIVILVGEKAYFVIALTDDGYKSDYDRVLNSFQIKLGL